MFHARVIMPYHEAIGQVFLGVLHMISTSMIASQIPYIVMVNAPLKIRPVDICVLPGPYEDLRYAGDWYPISQPRVRHLPPSLVPFRL
jgi:hypothetical protein